MEFPHEDQRAQEFGRSPGNGITPMPMSRDPLATEGEATAGPDNENPFEQKEREYGLEEDEIAEQRDPTAGDDPFLFDDVDESVDEVELPSLGKPPESPLF